MTLLITTVTVVTFALKVLQALPIVLSPLFPAAVATIFLAGAVKVGVAQTDSVAQLVEYRCFLEMMHSIAVLVQMQ